MGWSAHYALIMSVSGNNGPRDDVVEWNIDHSGLLASERMSIAADPFSLSKGNNLPVARVKKIMKEGEHPGMIAADAPIILAKACEMLIKDLTLQSWDCTLTTRRCTLQRQDVAAAIFKNHLYSFLLDIFPPEELYPKMELKCDKYIVQVNTMNRMKEGQHYSIIHDINRSNEGYARGNITIGHTQYPLAPNAICQGGNHGYVMNSIMQGFPMNSRSSHVTQGHSSPSVNTMMRYAGAVLTSGHIVENGHTAKVPIQVHTGTKSHATTQRVTPYSEGSLQSNVHTPQVLQSQNSYTQQVFVAPSEDDASQKHQPF